MGPIIQSPFARSFIPGLTDDAPPDEQQALPETGLQEETTSYERDMADQLLHASMEGNIQLILDLVNDGHGDLTVTNASGQSLLHVACHRGHHLAAAALMKAGIDILATDHEGATAVHMAAAHSHMCLEAIVWHLSSALCNEGGGISLDGSLNSPAQRSSFDEGRQAGVEGIEGTGALESGDQQQQQQQQQGNTAEAGGSPQNSPIPTEGCDSRSIRLISALSARDDSGLTPLHWAAREGNVASIRLLLDCGVDVLALDTTNRTAVFHAASHNQVPALQLLLEQPGRGQDAIALPDALGLLPLHAAASKGHAEALTLLVGQHVPVDTECLLSRRTALHLAAAGGHVTAAKALLQQLEASVNLVDAMGITPCHVAAEGGHLEVLVVLLEAGAAANVADREGWAPLHLASNHGHISCIDALLAAGGGPIDLPNTASGSRCGWTSLHCATKKGDLATVRHLISRGADPTLADGPYHRGWSPQHHAAADGLAAVLAVLADAEDSGVSAAPEPSQAQGGGTSVSGLAPQGGSGGGSGSGGSGLLGSGLSQPLQELGLCRDGLVSPANAGARPAGDEACTGVQAGLVRSVLRDVSPAHAAATQLTGHTPLSLAIVRHQQACVELLVRLAWDLHWRQQQLQQQQQQDEQQPSQQQQQRQGDQQQSTEGPGMSASPPPQHAAAGPVEGLTPQRRAPLESDLGGGLAGGDAGIGDWAKASAADFRRRQELRRAAAAATGPALAAGTTSEAALDGAVAAAAPALAPGVAACETTSGAAAAVAAEPACTPGGAADTSAAPADGPGPAHPHRRVGDGTAAGVATPAAAGSGPASACTASNAAGIPEHQGQDSFGGPAAVSLPFSSSGSSHLLRMPSSSGSGTSASPQAGFPSSARGTTPRALPPWAAPAPGADGGCGGSMGVTGALGEAAPPAAEAGGAAAAYSTPPSAKAVRAPYAAAFPSVPEEWEALGVVSGLVTIGPDQVLLTSQSNSDVEAWLMYVGGADRLDAGWQYFEVEVMEPGATGLFWVGWSTGLAHTPLQAKGTPHSAQHHRATKHSVSSPALSAGAAAAAMSGLHGSGGGSGAAAGGGGLGYGAHSAAPGMLGAGGRSHSAASHGALAGGGGFGFPGASGPGTPLASRGAGSAALLSGDGGGSHSSSCHLGTSYVVCSIDGHRVHLHGSKGHSSPFAPKLSKGDIVGFMHNRACCTISLTLNRKYLGICFSDITEGGGARGSASSGSDVWAYSSSMLPLQGGGTASEGQGWVSAAGEAAMPLRPIVGLKSGCAALRFISHGFHKNLDSLLYTEEKLHNPHHHDPASSTPWRFKTHMHALHFCAACNNQTALRSLLEHFPEAVDARDDDGWTPLAMACVHGNVECARLLIERGANVNATTRYGSTPIIFAVRYGILDAVGLLVNHGADLKAKDHNGRTLLMRAARSGNLRVLDQLLQKGVDLHARDRFGKSVLQFAKNDEVFRFLYNVESQDRLQPHLYDGPQGGVHRPSWSILPTDIEIEQWVLGAGSFGAVFKAKWQGSQVAVKQLQKLTPETLAKFEDEIQLMVQLRHPNVIQFLGAITSTNSLRGPAIVTELAARGNLTEAMQSARLHDALLIKMAADIARGMLYLHELKPRLIVHRDLKPGNCLVTHDYSVKIGDFGLSCVKQKEQFISTFQATPVYMAPELVEGNYDEKVDVYGFGAILFEMVMGHPPWAHLPGPAVLAILYGPKPRRCLRDDVPETGVDQQIRALIVSCLDPEPKQRPSFREILKTLEQLPRSTPFRLKKVAGQLVDV